MSQAGSNTGSGSGGSGMAPITMYVVSQQGNADYTTIPSAINALHTANTGGLVWLRSGTYNENLTLYPSINIRGDGNTAVTIVGTHILPLSGNAEYYDIHFSSSAQTFTNSAITTPTLLFDNCLFSCTDGFTFNLNANSTS